MQQKTINFWSHIRNLKNILIGIPIGFVLAVLYYLMTGGDKMVIYIFAAGYFLFSIPVILIHVNYLKKDKDKILSVDKSLDSIEIIDNHLRTKIDISTILRIIMTTGLEKAGGSFWSGYYYYQIDLKNGQTIFITSLLIKSKNFPFKVDLKKHTAFPFVKYFDPDKDLKTRQSNKDDNDKRLIDNFYNKFSDYSLEKLYEIVENKKIYDNSAIKAAEKLINEKITVANNVYTK